MAYTQDPGRGPLLKTGNGIPSALLQKPDYVREDERENEAISGGNTMDAAKGVSYTAGRMLTDFPSQAKHVKKKEVTNKDASGKTTSVSWETKVNAKNAVEQLQVAKDSMNVLKGIDDPKARIRAGETFSFFNSPNSEYGKKQINKAGGEYQGPRGVSGSQESKQKVLNDLKFEGIRKGQYKGGDEAAQLIFGIQKPPQLWDKNFKI